MDSSSALGSCERLYQLRHKYMGTPSHLRCGVICEANHIILLCASEYRNGCVLTMLSYGPFVLDTFD